MVTAGGWRGGNGELFNGYSVSVLQGETDSGDWLHSSMTVLTTTGLSTLSG